LAEAKTKAFVAVLKTLELKAPALVVVDRVDEVLARAARNVPRVEVTAAKDVSVYQLVRYPVVLATTSAMEQLKARLGEKAEVSK
jgi:ribosomal protein L4